MTEDDPEQEMFRRKHMERANRRTVLIAGTASLAAPAAAAEYRGYETPKWQVLHRDGPFELRDYAAQLAAEVSIKGNADTALRQGFQVLAGFIFGDNDGDTKVAMTAPVTRSPTKIAMTSPVVREGDGDIWTVRFMMPSEYTEDTLPKPRNEAIRIVTVAARKRAVLRFSGLASQTRINSAEKRLRLWMQDQGLQPVGVADAAWFDDPFTLPWRRRNEVSLAVSVA